ncbi:hypothetical protein ACP70R_031220 [Stipagrostis hirtigluma subsp. patula]
MRYRLLPKSQLLDDSDCSSVDEADIVPPEFLREAIFAAGSFYTLEAAFGQVDGVVRTATGYFGGSTVKPSYRQVLEGNTGHTEAVRVTYDQRKIAYKSLCNIFWSCHDPTNKDYLSFGAGTHHRSAIFYSGDNEKKEAQESKVKKQIRLDKRIVTKILPFGSTPTFYLAESQHQKYYLQNNHVRLCQAMGLRSSEQFVDSHLACKLNGILSGGQGKVAEQLKSFVAKYPVTLEMKLIIEEIICNFDLKLPSIV